MRRTIVPLRNIHFKPAFWGVDRDLREVMDNIENVWEGKSQTLTATDFKETQEAFFMSIDMPGVNKKNLEINIEGDCLFIKGSRKVLFSDDDSVTNLSHTIKIPQLADKDKIQAQCEDGVIYIALPKIEKAKPRKVEIKEGFNDKTWSKLIE